MQCLGYSYNHITNITNKQTQHSITHISHLQSGDEYVVAAVLGRVVGAPVAVHAPVARERRADALAAVLVPVAVVEAEIGRHEVGSGGHPHRQLGLDEVCGERGGEVSDGDVETC